METPSATPALPQPTATATPRARQPLTKEQRDAIFATAAATMQPARAPASSELLEWKSQIIEYYGKGFSAAQIRDLLHAGDVTTSERMVQRFLARYSHHRKRAAASSKAQASNTPAAAAPTPMAADGSSVPSQVDVNRARPPRQAAAKPSPESATVKRS